MNVLGREAIARAALRKARHFDGQYWTACLTPTQICALADMGAIATEHEIENARLRKQRGNSALRWFYFIPPHGELS